MDPHLTSVLGFSTAITAQSEQSTNEPLPQRGPNDYKWLQEALETNRPKDEPTQMKVRAFVRLLWPLYLHSVLRNCLLLQWTRSEKRKIA